MNVEAAALRIPPQAVEVEKHVVGAMLLDSEAVSVALESLAPGVGLKQYPCCASTHSAIDAMITLRQRHQLNLDQVERIETITHGSALAHTNRPDPRSALDAKFSVQYCVARALMHGGVCSIWAWIR